MPGGARGADGERAMAGGAADAFRAYLGDLRATRATGQATEHSYRPAVRALIEALGGADAEAVNEPAHGDYGAPDFIVQRRGVPIGHVECKDIGANLDAEENSEQLRRYRDALPNLVLTDQLEFRWYAEGERRATARLGRFEGDRFARERGGAREARALFEAFLTADAAAVADPSDLARRMAAKTRLLRDAVRGILADGKDGGGALRELLASYREVLIGDLGAEQFADLQAQTAAYGLFAARCLHEGDHQRRTRRTAS